MAALTGCQREINFDKKDGETRKCINCDYLPVCDSSIFTYVDEVASQIDTNRNVVRILRDSVVQGRKFTTITTFGFFSSGAWYNCDNGTYQTIIATSDLGVNVDSLIVTLLNGFPVPPGAGFPKQITITSLKLGVAVGST
jgi:hypothetical protein